MNTDPLQWRVGLVGYGEVGRILAEDSRACGMSVAAYDLKFAKRDDWRLEADRLFEFLQSQRS
ncbi:MAG TPA: hypothetical protein VJS42_21575 [Steroidobacteraceae bacterium]|nr:hypothetical protein [Steroidobacteraceae bacterium]